MWGFFQCKLTISPCVCVRVCVCVCVCVYTWAFSELDFFIFVPQDMMGYTSNYRSVNIIRCWIRKNLVHKLFSFQGNDIEQRNNMVFKQGKIAISDKRRTYFWANIPRGSCVRGNSNFRLLRVFRVCHCDPNSTVKMPLFFSWMP